MFNLEGLKKAGAWAILTTMVIPALLAVGKLSIDNKEKIAVLKSEEISIIRQLERIELKLDSIQNHLIQGE